MKRSTIIITGSAKCMSNCCNISMSHGTVLFLAIIFSLMISFSYYVFENQQKFNITKYDYSKTISDNKAILVKTQLASNKIDNLTGRLIGQNKDLDRLNTLASLSESEQDLLLNENYRQVFLQKEIIGSRLTKYNIKIGNRTLFEYFVDNEHPEQKLVNEQKIYDIKNNLQQIINSYGFKKEITICNVGDEEYIGLIENIMVFYVNKSDAQKNNMETAELAEKYRKQLKRELKIAKDNSFLQGRPIVSKIGLGKKHQTIAELSRNIERKHSFISSILKDDTIRIANVYGKTVQIQANYARTPSIYPLQYNFITSPYGFRVHPVTGRYILHTGMDFSALIGTRIKCTADGYISYAGWMYGYGNTIIVNHSFGMSTLYAHCSQLYVRRGQRVKKNMTIGLTGNSGLVAGPHLHYEIRKNNLSIDPAPYLNRDILTAKKDW